LLASPHAAERYAHRVAHFAGGLAAIDSTNARPMLVQRRLRVCRRACSCHAASGQGWCGQCSVHWSPARGWASRDAEGSTMTTEPPSGLVLGLGELTCLWARRLCAWTSARAALAPAPTWACARPVSVRARHRVHVYLERRKPGGVVGCAAHHLQRSPTASCLPQPELCGVSARMSADRGKSSVCCSRLPASWETAVMTDHQDQAKYLCHTPKLLLPSVLNQTVLLLLSAS